MRSNKRLKFLGPLALLLGCGTANAEWAFGPAVSYISGISDVVDIAERNLLAQPGVVEVDVFEIPVGVGLFTRYQADSGLRFDVGIGPAFAMISGDTDHFELPVFATVGYTFSPGADRSPYVRVGAAYHAVNGDFEVGSEPGVFAAIGLEMSRNDNFSWGFELSVDDSTVEFLDPAVFGNTEVNSYDSMLTFFFLF